MNWTKKQNKTKNILWALSDEYIHCTVFLKYFKLVKNTSVFARSLANQFVQWSKPVFACQGKVVQRPSTKPIWRFDFQWKIPSRCTRCVWQKNAKSCFRSNSLKLRKRSPNCKIKMHWLSKLSGALEVNQVIEMVHILDYITFVHREKIHFVVNW